MPVYQTKMAWSTDPVGAAEALRVAVQHVQTLGIAITVVEIKNDVMELTTTAALTPEMAAHLELTQV